jgi:serine/threonine protein kinase
MSVKKDKTAAIIKASQEFARKQVAKKFALTSGVENNTDNFPKFEKSELVMGKLLGKGGFGTVLEIRGFKVDGVSSKAAGKKGMRDSEADGMESKRFIAEHCLRNGGDARYAVKFLSPEVMADTALYIQGMQDMAIESRFLSDLEHPNIVKMRSLSHVDPYDPGFFIVMDRLYDTLEKRLEKWKARNGRCTGLAGRLGDRKGTKALSLMEDRLVAAFDLSSAYEHLHSRNIIYRDIKPDNIGFDVRGDVKVFDFGLSKEIHESMAVGDGTFKLTGYTGSIRYMAPEIAREEPYNMSCDVYSFALLLWQCLALEKPFSNYGISDIKTRVHRGESRPRVDDTWPVPLKLVLKKCWATDWKERYEFNSITQILRKEIVHIRSGDDTGLEHNRRRSTFVFRGNDKVKGGGCTDRAAAIAQANAKWKSTQADDVDSDDNADLNDDDGYGC